MVACKFASSFCRPSGTWSFWVAGFPGLKPRAIVWPSLRDLVTELPEKVRFNLTQFWRPFRPLYFLYLYTASYISTQG
jgi:hypothetical protein